MACSQETRVHWPSTSLVGYLIRRSLCTSARTLAPLAQCEPRLIGLSQDGSWPVHTPFWTSAVTVQPTAQCVHTLFLISVGTPGCGGLIAPAFRMVTSWNVPAAGRPTAGRPEGAREVRAATGRPPRTEE